MWLSVSGIIVLFLYVNPIVSKEVCSDGMIKEAILTLARVMKENNQKLERHEVRERLLGEHMKKVVGALAKKVSILDTFVSNVTKIEDRISEIEQLISQRDERERIQMQKTVNLIENLETHLEARLDEIKSTISAANKPVEPTEAATMTESIAASDIISKLKDTEANLLGKVTQIESSLNTMAVKNREEAARQAEKLQTVFNERNETEEIQRQFTENLLASLENRLEAQLEDIKNTIQEVRAHVEPTQTTTSTTAADIISRLNDTEAHFLENLAQIESNLGTMNTRNQAEAASQAEKLQTVSNEVKNISGRLGDIESLLGKSDEAAKIKSEEPREPIVDIEALAEEQSRAIAKVTELVKDTVNLIQNLPTISKVQSLHNETQAALQETKYILQSTLGDKIDGVARSVGETNVTTQESISALRLDLANNAEHVNTALRGLANGQGVMVTTADQVLDTKRRLDYGVHQILQDVGELIKSHSTVMNDTLNERFDEIAKNIISNQSRVLGNLKDKMEQELSQVWRQINSLYQQMTKSAVTLNKIHEENEAYVNGTISTMDGMETKVSDITKRMAEVDGNLNYLLGRLSLVTQEFNNIKTGLGSALDNIKASFKEVQEKANDLTHPGPYNIPADHQELDDNSNTESSTKPAMSFISQLSAN